MRKRKHNTNKPSSQIPKKRAVNHRGAKPFTSRRRKTFVNITLVIVALMAVSLIFSGYTGKAPEGTTYEEQDAKQNAPKAPNPAGVGF